MSRKNYREKMPLKKEVHEKIKNVIEYLQAPRPNSQEPMSIRQIYYRKRLFRHIMGLFRLINLPETWQIDHRVQEFILVNLFKKGYIAICDTPEYGIIPCVGNAYGKNIYGSYTTFHTTMYPATPQIKKSPFTKKEVQHEFYVGVNCMLLHLDHTWEGVNDIVSMYATDLAECDSGLFVSIKNSKMTAVFNVADDAQAKTAKAAYEDISMGEPAVFIRKQNAEEGAVEFITADMRQSFVGDLIRNEKTARYYDFLTDIGIPNPRIDKKERVNTQEINSVNAFLRNAIFDWKENIEKDIEAINKKFGLNIEVIAPFYDMYSDPNVYGMEMVVDGEMAKSQLKPMGYTESGTESINGNDNGQQDKQGNTKE